MDLIIRAKNSYEQLMKRESHLFAQETKLISEFWNLKKRIPTSTSRKVNLHVSIPHSWQYNSLTQKTPKKQVQHGWTVSSKIIWQNKNNQCLIMKGHWALIELKFKILPSATTKGPSDCVSLHSKIQACLCGGFHSLCCISVVND